MTGGVRLRHVADINPPTPEFVLVPDDAEITFLPLEAVWPGSRLDTTRVRLKSTVLSGYTRFRESDILIPKITPTFEADRSTIARGLMNGVAAGTTELHVVRPRENVDGRYLDYLVSSRPFLLGGEAEMIGVAGQKRVPDSWLRDFPIPITDRGTQATIAEFLDGETARIDALIAKKNSLRSEVTAKVLSLIDWSIWSDDHELVPLRRIVQFVDYRGATPAKATSGVPLITASHVRDGYLDMNNDPQWLDEQLYLEWMRRGWPEAGDVLLTTEAPLGNVAQIVDEHVALAQRVVLMKPNRSAVRADFIAGVLRSPTFKQTLFSYATGSTALGIKADRLKGLAIPLPPLNVQDRCVDEIRRIQDIVFKLGLRLDKQIALLRQRKQALITAAVTGEMEVPGVS